MAAMTNFRPPSPECGKLVERVGPASQSGDVVWNAGECLAELDCNGEPEIFLDLAAAFVEDGARRLAALRQAVHNGEIAKLRAQVHSLKGSSSQVGAKALAELCANIEQHCTRQPRSEILALLDQLEATFRSTCQAMLAYAADVSGNQKGNTA